MEARSREISIRRNGWTARADASVPAALLQRLLDDPGRPFWEPDARIVKDGDTTRVARLEWALANGMRPVAYKCVRRLSWFKRLTQALGVNRTWRTYLAGRRLEELQIPTARPLLVLIPDRRHLHRSTWVAHEWLEEARHLGELVRRIGWTRQEPLDDVARRLGDVLGRLHRAGGTHRDLKPENILIRLADGGGETSVWLIDLDGLRFRPLLTPGRRWRDLSRLAVGVIEFGGVRNALQLRFVHAYCRALGDDSDWKQIWHRLRKATDVRMRQRARRKPRRQQTSS